MSRIEYAYAESGATLIRVNEHDRVCLTRSIPENVPDMCADTGWKAAHFIITGSCAIRHAHTALAQHKPKAFLYTIQKLERAETRTTSKPRSFGEYDGTDLTADVRAAYPVSYADRQEQISNMRGSRGYHRPTYNNGFYSGDWCAKHVRATERHWSEYNLDTAIAWYRSE